MKVSLMTPQQVVFSGDAQDVLLNAHKGQINILEKHADLITTLAAGPLRIRTGTHEKNYNISGGVMRVQGERCSILCMSAQEA